jgi:two-component system, OmpR family, sensor histidine kinase CiaH
VFKKLRNRFLLSNMLLTLAVFLVIFAVIYLSTYNTLRLENKEKLTLLPSSVQKNQETPVPAAGSVLIHTVDVYDGTQNLGNVTYFSVIVDSDGSVDQNQFARPGIEEAYKTMILTTWHDQKSGSLLTLGKTKWTYTFNLMEGSDKYQIFFMDITQSQKTLSDLAGTFILAGLITIAMVFLISLISANRAVKPVAEAWEKQQRFIADASHELKTPLAIIQANTDALLLKKEETIENQQKWIGYIQDEIARMSKLTGSLLLLAKTEDTQIQNKHADFDYSKCVSKAVLSLEAIIYEKKIELPQAIESGIHIISDADQVRQIVTILLDNAVNYTNEGGTIEVTLKKGKRNVEFTVKNSGSGIPAKDIPRLFDRFYRVDASRDSETGGFGLGLSIAKAMADRLNGQLTVQSVENVSTTFTFTIKKFS